MLRVRLYNLLWECWLGINTHGVAPGKVEYYYSTSGYREIFAILRELGLMAQDTFVDVGCGKGRVLCCAAYRYPCRVVGIEYAPELADKARVNAERLRQRRGSISVLNINALDYDFTEGTVFYFFNPFGRDIWTDFLTRMHQQVNGSRTIRIVYVNPVHEEILRQFAWLQCYQRLTQNRYGFLLHEVSFWQTCWR
jgi:cyclopropane fatty-acyl-phospholipid synthase-like methyltransferase